MKYSKDSGKKLKNNNDHELFSEVKKKKTKTVLYRYSCGVSRVCKQKTTRKW